MKEIGGYIELDVYRGSMLHENAILLNCGRNALAYLIKAKGISKIQLPYFLCDSVTDVCNRYGVNVSYYHIGLDWMPRDLELDTNEWLYVVNFYGQISNHKILKMAQIYKNIIIDNAQAYFQEPVDGVDTLYTCRKFFGVPDGAILYTNNVINEPLEQDVSYTRMQYLLGRYEKTASEFYTKYVENNHLFSTEPIKRMSRLTQNLLHGIDYDVIKRRRTENFMYLFDKLQDINMLGLSVPEGAFMYPLYLENGYKVRELLQEKKIYIPMLWPYVIDLCNKSDLEYELTLNILPLPVDQRYSIEHMDYIIETIGML